MALLSLEDIENVNLAIADIYCPRKPEMFFREIPAIIKNLLSSELASYNEYDTVSRFTNVVPSSPDHDRIFKKFEIAAKQYIPTHVGFTISSLDRCTILSDLIKPSDFKKTELYNEYYRHMDIQSQLFTELPAPQGKRSFLMLSRSRPTFSDRERFMLSLIKPHVIGAYRNVLELQCYKEKIALFEEDEDFPALRTLGLTSREAVILGWAAKGKSNTDIASILGISRRTVEKHFERIFEKLGVETKMAAVSVIVNMPAPRSPVLSEQRTP